MTCTHVHVHVCACACTCACAWRGSVGVARAVGEVVALGEVVERGDGDGGLAHARPAGEGDQPPVEDVRVLITS